MGRRELAGTHRCGGRGNRSVLLAIVRPRAAGMPKRRPLISHNVEREDGGSTEMERIDQ